MKSISPDANCVEYSKMERTMAICIIDHAKMISQINSQNFMKLMNILYCAGATKLTVIDLSDNLLQSIPPRTFDGLTKENIQIDLYENPLLCDCSMAPFRQWSDQVRNSVIFCTRLESSNSTSMKFWKRTKNSHFQPILSWRLERNYVKIVVDFANNIYHRVHCKVFSGLSNLQFLNQQVHFFSGVPIKNTFFCSTSLNDECLYKICL